MIEQPNDNPINSKESRLPKQRLMEYRIKISTLKDRLMAHFSKIRSYKVTNIAEKMRFKGIMEKNGQRVDKG